MTSEQLDAHLLGVALITQYNIKKGRELFGKKADDAILEELTEIDSFETYQPLHENTLTREQKLKALEALFFLAELRGTTHVLTCLARGRFHYVIRMAAST